MAKPEFDAGDRVSWNYGVGKGTGHIVERVTKTTKLYGKNFKATPEEPKYRIKSDKGKAPFRLHVCSPFAFPLSNVRSIAVLVALTIMSS